MSKSTKTTKPAKKKSSPKKKAKSKKFVLWLDFNFPDRSVLKDTSPPMTKAQIEASYKQVLAIHDQGSGENHSIKFHWTVLTGFPKITNMKALISPPPKRRPTARNGGPGGSVPLPPQPPKPPPPNV